MNEYMVRLKKLEFKNHEALRVYECFKNYISLEYLDILIRIMENDEYVANV